MKLICYLTALAILLNTNVLCGTLGDKARNIQAQIRQIQSKCQKPKSEEEYIKLRKEFKLMNYFDILKNLKMKSGYILDYLPIGDFYGSYPLILALDSADRVFIENMHSLMSRKAKDSIQQIRNKMNKFVADNCTKNKDYPDLPQSMTSENCIGYMKYLDVKDSEDGYLEFIILRIIGNQFLLNWHAGYNDRKVVTSKEEAVDLLIGSEKDFRAEIDKIDFEPKIEIDENEVKIRICVFTKWGGLIEMKYVLEKGEYISIKEAKENELILYDCGISF